jgi:hypothetical protein
MKGLISIALTTLWLTGVAEGGPQAAAAERRPPYEATIHKIGPKLRQRMTSWRHGCPVHIRDLRLVRVTVWGFDHHAHRGPLIVHEDHARRIRWVMRVLYRRKFPIRRLRLVDAYGSDDRRSMAADNTSAFNCRFVAGTSRWSMHAYGQAIDINPVENPYVSGGRVSPPAGRRYTDRSSRARGVIHRRGFVVRSFRRIGWEWGGNWSGVKDYMHFSSTGT